MIDLHISVGAIFAFIGIVALTGIIAWYAVMLTALMNMDTWHWPTVILGYGFALVEFFGGTWLLGRWAGLW